MKKIILLAFMAMITLFSQAQIVTSRSTGISKIKRWSTFGVDYLPSKVELDHGGSESFTGLAINWTTAENISHNVPLFVEIGIGVQYSFYSDESYLIGVYPTYSGYGSYGTSYSYYTQTIDEKLQMLSLKIPVNFIYDFSIPNTNVSIDPYLGLRLRFNWWGEFKVDDLELNVFDEDDMGKGNTFNTFQVGWQIGTKVRFNNNFFIGIAYGSDFTEIAKEITVNETQLSLGLVF